ncbi:MAG: alpha/beta fold hydrolase [Planctomycetota bacterium]|nr:alpha/beta fold hydrolase [Planctomycetota bacterium]
MTDGASLTAARAPLPELYPFASHFLELDGIRLHYLDEGEGEPVVMLHGNPTWSFYFRRLVSGLRNTHRLIVPDHIGCGLSDKPGDDRYDYTLARRVRDLEALLDHLDLGGRVSLILHDWGGMIGMAHAVRHPERIRRIVVLNTAAFHLPESKPLPFSLRLLRVPGIGAVLVRGLNLFCRSAASACCARGKMPADVRDAYLAPYDSWAHRIAILRFVQDIPLRPGDRGYDLVTEVSEGLGGFVKTPMMICWGMKDFVFDEDFLAEWVRRCPHAEVHRFDDAGHYILEDVPEEVLERVREFLNRE